LTSPPTTSISNPSPPSTNGLIAYPEVILFASHDHKFLSTVANRIVEFTPAGFIERSMTFDEYLESAEVAKVRQEHFGAEAALAL
jgi:ATPase subunit of ABC transporter with duplicated ATPase domains